MAEDLVEIVITGGPCAGKTTSLARIQQWLMDAGRTVLTVPEAATMLINGGLPIGRLLSGGEKELAQSQEIILSTQLALISRFRHIADVLREKGDDVVILHDRGPMDNAAYIEPSLFSAILSENGLSLHELRDRFNAVIHLVTAADGAEEFYTLGNNAARSESPEQARQLDKKTQLAWLGHPHLKVIDNSTNFDSKIKRVIQFVARVVGIPVPLEIERKFVLDGRPIFDGQVEVREAYIEQMYLAESDGVHVRLRARKASDGSCTYYKTIKSATASPLIRSEQETRITFHEYLELQRLRDPETEVIHKIRRCFLWKNQYFEQDEFLGGSLRGLNLLEVELTEDQENVELPPFVKADREVTGKEGYLNYNLSRRK